MKLRTAERLVNLLAILCLISWRVFWMTMLNRTRPDASPKTALTPTEIYLLDQLVGDSPGAASTGNALSLYLTKLARLGGYLARAKDPPPGNTVMATDPPPGNTVMWRGITELPASTIYNSASSLELNLWVIERKIKRLHANRA